MKETNQLDGSALSHKRELAAARNRLNHIFFELRGVRSIRRAIKRGRIVGETLTLAPKRPFNNRANTCKRKGAHSRNMNVAKQRIYGEFKRSLSQQPV